MFNKFFNYFSYFLIILFCIAFVVCLCVIFYHITISLNDFIANFFADIFT